MNALLRRPGGARRASATAFLVASLAIVAAVSATRAAASQASPVALAFAGATHALIRADAHALYLSRDEGRDWQPVTLPKAVAQHAIASIAVGARGADVLYIAGPALGLWRSRDGGRNWMAKSDGLPSTAVTALAAHADQPDTVYAYVPRQGIFRSDDGGDHWRLMDVGPREPIVRFVHSNMQGSMQTGWLFAATANGVSRSMDCFCGWRDAGALKSAITGVAYDPKEPKRVYAVTAEDVLVSEDGGEQWSRAESPGASITALVVGDDGIVYAAAGHGVLFRSSDHGHTWLRVDG